MGVPAFFRWLTRKYPSVVASCREISPKDVNGKLVSVDASEPNPNGFEFDNLYLDMNGIIHPCTHPEDKPPPDDEDEMMVAIFECIDRLLNIVRPRKLLYMAVDGVAPRAKMNQQRSRRFRASKETVEKRNEIEVIRSKLRAKGCILPPPKDPSSHFDSNCITPGTPFMSRLSNCLQYYAHSRLNTNPAWKNVKIIISDANVPGEGEHKIMDFIRKQRAQPDHDPNTTHCLCGADADLIMLGLATHEPNFVIIREEFRPNKDRPCDVCYQPGHDSKNCNGLEADAPAALPIFSSEVQFIFVRLYVLREYLRKELDMPGLPFVYDFERAVDDWVFMCFFVGNDFLPHLPSLEIREGAIDRLIGLYKKAVYKTGGYLTDSGMVSLNRVQLIMSELGVMEDEIFRKRQQNELSFRARIKAKRIRESRYNHPTHVLSGQYAPRVVGAGESNTISNPRQEIYQQRMESMSTNASSSANGDNNGRLEKRPLEDEEDEPEPLDEVRLWESGFKDRYYKSKFDADLGDIHFRHRVASEYVLGLCWVLKYYYQGCASWKWYFPYHYAPFASDFLDVAEIDVEFEKNTQPFRPLEQLMSVFPAGSKEHVPQPWSHLMYDPDSPIIDFYPEDFKIDLNGKKFAWQGVALLPFVDEERLHKALAPFYHLLTDTELKRNIRGEDRLYVSQSNVSYSFLKGLYEHNGENATVEFSYLSEGMMGRVLLSSDCVKEGRTFPSPVIGLESIVDNRVLSVSFRDPKFGENHVYLAKRLEGAVDPTPILKPSNMSEEQARHWRPQIGMAPATQRGSVGMPGHRMLGHYVRPGMEPNTGGPGSWRSPFPYRQPQPSAGPSYGNSRYGGGYQQSSRDSGFGDSGGSGYSRYDRRGGGGGGGYSGNYGGYQQQQQRGYPQNDRRYDKGGSDDRGRYRQDDRRSGDHRDDWHHRPYPSRGHQRR